MNYLSKIPERYLYYMDTENYREAQRLSRYDPRFLSHGLLFSEYFPYLLKHFKADSSKFEKYLTDPKKYEHIDTIHALSETEEKKIFRTFGHKFYTHDSRVWHIEALNVIIDDILRQRRHFLDHIAPEINKYS